MATTFKNFLNNDVTSTRTLLHEAIPITGSILSGTYNNPAVVYSASNADANIKNYSHGLFQSVYDYPYLSSSANHIFDITVGYSNNSTLSGAANVQNADKINIYNQMAQVLVGHDATGSMREFDQDGDFTGGTKLRECVFLNFARLLNKDEMKKGSFTLKVGVSGSFSSGSGKSEFNDLITITDTSAATSYKVNSPAGEYAILKGTGSSLPADTKVGLLYYQAGVAVLTGSVFLKTAGATTDGPSGTVNVVKPGEAGGTGGDIETMYTTYSISGSADSMRHRIYDIDFNNTTELNSTIYFCRAGHNEFNYSSNPTYLSASQIRVKNSTLDQPVAYITTVGLYSADNELLAVAKLSEPLKKTPDTELTLRVRLDY